MFGTMTLVPSLGLFSFCWFALFNIDMIGFVTVSILFCYAFLNDRINERRDEDIATRIKVNK